MKHSHDHSSLSRLGVMIFAGATIAAGCGGASANNGSSGTSTVTGAKTADVPTDKPKEVAPPKDTANPAGTSAPSGTVKAPSPFHLVADVDYELELHRLGKNAVFMGGGQILPIRDNTVTFEPKYALTQEIRGDGLMGAFETLLGMFPDQMYACVVRPSGRTGINELYKWTGTKWTSDYITRETMAVLDLQPWINGTLLALEQHTISGDFGFSVLPKGSKVFVPQPNDPRKMGYGAPCETGFIADSIRAVPSGHAFVTGVTCTQETGPDDGQYGTKHYSSASPKGSFDAFPDVGKKGFTTVALALRNEKDAYVGGLVQVERFNRSASSAPYLAHYDGASWKTSTLPFSDGIRALEYDAQGKLWAISDKGAVYSRTEGGSWAEVSLPLGNADVPVEAMAIWSRGPGDEWILGHAGKRTVVLHSGPRGPMAELPDLETMDDKVAELAMPTPLTSRCTTPFVLLYTLSKVAPPDFDYPATREALKGHTEFEGAQFIEFKRLDKRFMGAFVPDADMGKKLVEFVKKKVPNSTPQLACHRPKASRSIEIDLSRGN